MGIFSIFKKKVEIKREIIKKYIIEIPYRRRIEKEELERNVNDDEYILGKYVYSYLDKENIDGINMS